MAPSTNSPRGGLKTPEPLVSGTGLSTISGKSRPSRPAARECTQRSWGHMVKTSRNSEPDSDQLKSTTAWPAARAKASAVSPVAMEVSSGREASCLSWGSAGFASTRTVILSISESYHMFDLSLEMLRVVEEAAIASARVRFIDTTRLENKPDVKVRFH